MNMDRRTFCKAAAVLSTGAALPTHASLMLVSGNRSGPAAELPGAIWISQDEIDWTHGLRVNYA